MNKEEYSVKIAELRKKRDFHDKESAKCQQEMDALQIDEKYNEMLKGEYVFIDNSPVSGYKTYIHVDRWEKRLRGAQLYGKGFITMDSFFRIIDTESIYYEECFSKNYSIITKEEYENAFNNAIELIKREFYGKD